MYAITRLHALYVWYPRSSSSRVMSFLRAPNMDEKSKRQWFFFWLASIALVPVIWWNTMSLRWKLDALVDACLK